MIMNSESTRRIVDSIPKVIYLVVAFLGLITVLLCIGRSAEPTETAGPNGISDYQPWNQEGWRSDDHDWRFRAGVADSGDPFIARETR